MNLLAYSDDGPALAPVSPFLEMGAYEALWLEKGATFKTIAERFSADPSALPSDFVSPSEAQQRAHEVMTRFKKAGVHRFGVRIHHAGDYPLKLREAKYPVELLYYRGSWELAELPSIAVVGSRKATPDGERRARKVARALVAKGYVVVSGLAEGIDTAAHEAAMEAGGKTIAVVGTPLDSVYPKKNKELQERIANDFLLISQVPALRYASQIYLQNRMFFPERNVTMSALTDATIIVEAGETSGTLIQARAALQQGRKLFIMDSCFAKSEVTWPKKYEEQGAVRIKTPEDIWKHFE